VDADPLLLQGPPHRLVPGSHAHLLVDVCQVALDGGLGDVQLPGHPAVGEAARRALRQTDATQFRASMPAAVIAATEIEPMAKCKMAAITQASRIVTS
jgi:hypothetical protein